ncbi:3-oxo-tetronate kinase [Robbsia sp. KACC 23696]|uniref:3-oxo-tetronate kinase n=1 Tax=Robbsia sp. KACC 23696 TaxID=3149231 RepID=UPI00325B4149
MSNAPRPLLGCIADDFTGATDLANILVRGGMRTVQTIGVPEASLANALDADAIVIALKSRTAPVAQAIDASLRALAWLREQGCRQFFFKYCSTFDSTDAGNIGPVAEALMAALGTDFTIACPAFPAAGRTLFRGHLFVMDTLLSESGMAHHPLTPMHDANLVRVLQRQTTRNVGLVRQDVVAKGAAAVRTQYAALQADGVGMAIADAIDDADLMTLGEACAAMPLVTGGSGVAMGLPANFRKEGLLREGDAALLPFVDAPTVVLAGSASQATQRQVAAWLAAGHPAYRLDAMSLSKGQPVIAAALAVAREAIAAGKVALVYATTTPDDVKAVQAALGVEAAGAMIEDALGKIAKTLLDEGVGRFIVAGGETSGAIVNALDVKALRIGAQIDPGVPLTATLGGGRTLSVVLKSGNFGSDDFFEKTVRLVAADGANTAIAGSAK